MYGLFVLLLLPLPSRFLFQVCNPWYISIGLFLRSYLGCPVFMLVAYFGKAIRGDVRSCAQQNRHGRGGRIAKSKDTTIS
jgi:hypothetical protein